MGDAPYLFLERTTWAAIFFGSYVSFFFLSSFVFGREGNIARGDDRDRGSRGLIIVLTFAGLGIAFAGPFLMPSARIDLPAEPLFGVAMALFWTGALLYFWAFLTLGRWFRTAVQLLEGQRLVTRGPYRVLRHPAYTGGILLFAGVGLAIGNWLSFAVLTLSVFLSYVWRIHVEEIALHERFGAEFETQRRRTWAVIPFLW
ncbi:MAG: isoprenylcysteine carboxylmethyltransferase family protein [Rhizomicrobium sp.]